MMHACNSNNDIMPHQFTVNKMVTDSFKRLSAEPKIRQYDAKTLRAVTMNRKRRRMNNENEVSGVDVIGYQITDYRRKHATIRLRGGVELRASFVEFRKSEKREAMSCFSATRQVSHQSILAPIFLSYSTKKKRILLFYQRYDSLLANWRGGDGIWWQQAIREQIWATKYLQDKGFIHTGLNDPKNFAIQDNKLKMLNISSSLQEYLEAHPGTNEETIKRDNFKSLRDLMRVRYQEKKALTQDDEAFFNLFDRDDINYRDLVHKLITHPCGMNYTAYMWCFQRIYLANVRGYLDKSLSKVMEDLKFLEYHNWIDTIQSNNGQHLKEALPKDVGERENGKYKNEDIETLVLFLRNIVEHKHGQSDHLSSEQIAKYYEEVCAEVQELFPRFLSLLLEEVNLESKFYWIFEFESV